MRLFLLSFFFVLAIGSVVVLGLLEFWSGQSGVAISEQVFTINPGENALVVATNLENAGIVRSRFGFLYSLARLKKIDGGMMAGEYRLSPVVSSREIALRITTGQTLSRDIRVTFPEGFTALQMAGRLTEAGLPGDIFLLLVEKSSDGWRSEFPFLQSVPSDKGLEGFLFPDTYRFDRQADAESIIRIMLETFEKKAWPFFLGQTHSYAYEMLVLASVVETEVRSDYDRSRVAGIFLRRLAIGQPLQSDATVKYVLGLNKVQHSFEETRTNSPYNTYIHKGLPPGPIANPGLSAITATLNPVQDDTFYFLSNPKTGETVFAKTFEEHVRNKAANGL
ncbi:MAG: endolytic transglycosylase MltG [Candidatus Moranbacteria bacterium]|nr:endolytic transglycosylase MltG [Candidatus Moranbacteria bacterium]